MPRGKRVLKELTEEVKQPKQAKKPSTRGGRGRKKMEEETKQATKKRKTKAEAEEPAENDVPPPKKAKAPKTDKKKGGGIVEETDRVVDPVIVETQLPKVKPTKKTRGDDDTRMDVGDVSNTTPPISHPSHSTSSGQVMTIGQGDVGQLGLGEDIVERKKPFPVCGALEGKKVVQVVCGGMHTVALTDDGQVYTWGCNDEGALGRKTGEGDEYLPGRVEKMNRVKVVQVSGGDSHTAALASNGNVYLWGVFRDSNGPFGLIKPGVESPLPELVYSSSFNRAIKIVSGSDHLVILTDQGDLYTLGCAEQGQLGRVPECFSSRGGRKGIQTLLDPQVVRFRKLKGIPKPKFSDVFCGSYHTFALSQNNRLYAWGLNNYGQLGTDDVESRYNPELLPTDWIKEKDSENNPEPTKYEKLDISGGQHHTIICQNGRVYALGRKNYGRLGLGENSDEPHTPRKVPDLSDVTRVAAGTACSFAVTKSGDVYSCGMGTNLQLGMGEGEEDLWTFTKIVGKKIENRDVIASSAGGQHSALLVSLPQEPMEY